MNLPTPKNPSTPPGHLIYEVQDDGGRYIVFRADPEHLDAARNGRIVGLLFPATVPVSLIHELVSHTVENGGMRYVVRPFDEVPPSIASLDQFVADHVQLSDGRFVAPDDSDAGSIQEMRPPQ
jgi:hypothetical protein